jgi:hypothetical protein
MEKYYTPEQLEQLRLRGEQIGAERIRQVEAEWSALFVEVKAAMERGDDPASAHVQGLEKRWAALVKEFSGGDAGLEKASLKVWEHERPMLEGQHGWSGSREVFEYLVKARAAAGLPPP